MFHATTRRPHAGFRAVLGTFLAAAALTLSAAGARGASVPASQLTGVHWVRIGATVDPTRGQAPFYSAHQGMSFAELLEAGANAGMRPDITQLLGLPRGAYGMPMETAILVRLPGSGRVFKIWKNDVGSGQRRDRRYKIDLHPGIARALGVSARRFKGYVEVAIVPVASTARDHASARHA